MARSAAMPLHAPRTTGRSAARSVSSGHLSILPFGRTKRSRSLPDLGSCLRGLQISR